MVSELQVMNDNFYCTPQSYGAVCVTGADAAAFLQDHFCNDVSLLTTDSAQLSGYCTPKGRLLAIITVVRSGDDYFLVLHHSVLASVVKRLSMFAMMPRPAGKESGGRMVRTDVALKDVSAQYKVVGVSGDACTDDASGDTHRSETDPAHNPVYASEHRICFRHDSSGTRTLCLVDTNTADRFISNLNSRGFTEISEAEWELMDIRAGLPQITADTQESVVPQMANLHSLHAVSFKKGCYPGQEIVARMHYLGKLKRITQRFRVSGGRAEAGGLIVDSSGKEAGLTLRVADAGNGDQEILAVIRTAALSTDGDSGSQTALRLETTPESVLRLLELPYTVQTESNG